MINFKKMENVKRSEINGFSFKILNGKIEIVFVRNFLSTICFTSKSRNDFRLIDINHFA